MRIDGRSAIINQLQHRRRSACLERAFLARGAREHGNHVEKDSTHHAG